VFDWLTAGLGDGALSYAIVAVAAGADVLFPLVPSETILIAAAVLAAQGNLTIALIVPAAAIGALVGDNLAYLIGDRAGDPVVRRLIRGEGSRSRFRWARRAIRRRGWTLIAIGRFVPGGRSASTLAAGTLGMAYRRFFVADLVAAVSWALYVSMLGYLGGSSFEGRLWLPLGLGLAAASLLTAGLEVWRRLQRRRGRDLFGDPLDDDEEPPPPQASVRG
jgi:membrane protein DedA with SNARE-associated domain